MPRKLRLGQKPITDFEVYHGFDSDCGKWFVEIQIPIYGVGTITQWYDSEKLYEDALKQLLWTIYN